MDNRKLIAYAVDADTGKITWRHYDEPWKNGRENDDYYLERALTLEVW